MKQSQILDILTLGWETTLFNYIHIYIAADGEIIKFKVMFFTPRVFCVFYSGLNVYSNIPFRVSIYRCKFFTELCHNCQHKLYLS